MRMKKLFQRQTATRMILTLSPTRCLIFQKRAAQDVNMTPAFIAPHPAKEHPLELNIASIQIINFKYSRLVTLLLLSFKNYERKTKCVDDIFVKKVVWDSLTQI